MPAYRDEKTGTWFVKFYGIELAYREVYEEGSRADRTDMSGERLQKLAEIVAGELKPEVLLPRRKKCSP